MPDRILIASDGIPPYVIGGMQKHSMYITEHLARQGFEIVLYHIVEPGVSVSDSEVAQHFPVDVRKSIVFRTFEYEDAGKLPGHYMRAQLKLARKYFEAALLESDIQFIYSKGFVGHEILQHRNKLPYQCPIAVKFHGMNMFQKQPNFKGEITKYFFRSKTRWIMRSADFVFSYGGKITEIILDQGVDIGKIIELPSGIDDDWMLANGASKKMQTSKKTFLFVGRYDRVKGLPEYQKAIDLLLEKGYEAKFVFIGDIPEAFRLTQESCTYLGKVSDSAQVRSAYDEADFLVCPSFSEGMPNVILEAMSRGTPCIATDVGAVRLLVSEKTGILIQQPDPYVISRALMDAIDMSPDMYSSLSKSCLDLIGSHFTWSSLSIKLCKVIESKIPN